MSLFSYISIISSYTFGELISCLRFYMQPIFINFSPSNGGAFLLAVTKVS